MDKSYTPVFQDITIIPRYIMKKIAGKIPALSYSRKKFFVVGEEPIDILYKHMLWNFKNTSKRELCVFNEKQLSIETSKSDNDNIGNFNFKQINENVDFKNRKELVKINKHRIERKKYKIEMNHIKDLLSLYKPLSSSVDYLSKEDFK